MNVFKPMRVRLEVSTELSRTVCFHSQITPTHTTVEIRFFPVLGPSLKVGENRMTTQHATVKLIATAMLIIYLSLGQKFFHLFTKLLKLCNTNTQRWKKNRSETTKQTTPEPNSSGKTHQQ